MVGSGGVRQNLGVKWSSKALEWIYYSLAL